MMRDINAPSHFGHWGNLGGLGVAGVDVFFVISGFVMVYISRDKFGIPVSAYEFIANRLKRIVPLCWVFLTLTILMNLARHKDSPLMFILECYLFLPICNSAGQIQNILAQAWSLEYELFFYVIFSAWLIFGSWRKTPLFLALFLGTAIALARLSHGSNALKYFLSEPIMLEFVFGAFAGWLFCTGRLPGRKIGLGLIVASSVLFIWPALISHQIQPRVVFWGIPAFMVVLGSLSADRGKTKSLLAKIGDWSYSIYLSHICVMRLIIAAIKGHMFHAPIIGDLAIACIVPMCIGIGYLSYGYIETPIANWFKPRPVPRSSQIRKAI